MGRSMRCAHAFTCAREAGAAFSALGRARREADRHGRTLRSRAQAPRELGLGLGPAAGAAGAAQGHLSTMIAMQRGCSEATPSSHSARHWAMRAAGDCGDELRTGRQHADLEARSGE